MNDITLESFLDYFDGEFEVITEEDLEVGPMYKSGKAFLSEFSGLFGNIAHHLCDLHEGLQSALPELNNPHELDEFYSDPLRAEVRTLGVHMQEVILPATLAALKLLRKIEQLEIDNNVA